MPTIRGTTGNDILSGGIGDDTLIGGLGNDRLSGGDGIDTAVFSGRFRDYTLTFDPGFAPRPFNTGRPASLTISGPDGSDTLQLIPGLADAIFDVERLQFDDLTVLIGPNGQVVIQNPAGSDSFTGGTGVDTVQFAGNFSEYTISFSANSVMVDGPDGRDVLTSIEQGRFADLLGIFGSGVNDILRGGLGNQALVGGSGDDRLFGEEGNDTLIGGDGNDFLAGDGWLDSLGNFSSRGPGGDDLLIGGAGYDTAYFPLFLAWASFARVNGNLVVTTQPSNAYMSDDYAGVDTLIGVEELRFGDRTVYVGERGELIQRTTATIHDLYGTALEDTLTGSARDNILVGGAGDDALYGFGGNDTLRGDDGNDGLAGGDGDDSLSGGNGDDSLDGGTGNDLLVGGAGNDIIYGGLGNDRLDGGDGDDRLVAGEGDDVLIGGSGVDTAVFGGPMKGSLLTTINGVVTVIRADGRATLNGVERLEFSDRTVEISADGFLVFNGNASADLIEGTSAKDRMDGGSGNDVLDGFGGDDFLIGGAGNDTLFGSRGNDVLYGEDGNDNLYGGQGDDTLNGGAGNDLLKGGAGRNVINGGDGTDVLVLDGAAAGYRFSGNASSFVVSRGASQQTVTSVERISFDGGATSTSVKDVMMAAFDPWAYLFQHRDLLNAYGLDAAAARNHYETFGYNEGRSLGSFNALAYAASYSDLSAAFGTNAQAAANHYLTRGMNEGRAITFDPAAYAAANPDIAAIAGFDANIAAAHYINFGRAEGRATSGFDSVAYLLSYSDLAGMTAEEARDHWLTTGAREGRLGDSVFGHDQATHTLGSTIFSTIDRTYDYDWFEVTLTAGQRYALNVSGAGTGVGTLASGQVRLYDNTGQLLGQDDHLGPNGDARLYYTATESATYYVIVNGRLGATGGYWFNYAAIASSGTSVAPESGLIMASTANSFEPFFADDSLAHLTGSSWSGPDFETSGPAYATDWQFL